MRFSSSNNRSFPNTIRVIVVGALFVIGSMVSASSAEASCGDYVIITGEVPAWVKTKTQHSRSATLLFETHRQSAREIAEQFASHERQPPCHGPGCGQGQPNFAETVFVLPVEIDTSLLSEQSVSRFFRCSDRFARPINDGRYSSCVANPLDRPPQSC